MEIFERSKQWLAEERYALTDQIRRSSRSVCSNIGEAWFKRSYPRHFASKLSDAGSEASETIVWLDFALECGYVQKEEITSLSSTYRRIIGGLTKMIAHPEKWCVTSVSEEPAMYGSDSGETV